MSGVSFGAEMYDTNNKGSLDLSQYKKQACLNLWKIAHFVSKVISNQQQNNWFNGSTSVSSKLQIVDALEKTLTQYFPAINNNQSPNSGFL